MEKTPNLMALLRRYQRFVDFDERGRPLHPLFDDDGGGDDGGGDDGGGDDGGGDDGGGDDGGGDDGARFKGHAIVIHQLKELLLEHDTSRNEWKLPATAYTKTKNQAVRLLDKRYPADKSQVIYVNMNNFDEHQTRHRWTESIVKRYDAPVKKRFKGQWFEKGALPRNIRVFDGIVLHQYLKWH
jgi:hypothetical protein